MTARNAAQGNQAIKYDPEQRPARVETTGGSPTLARFAYGWDGERLKRLDNAGTAHSPFPFYERNVGNGSTVLTEAVTRLYHANLGAMRRRIAVRKGPAAQAGTLTYVGTDHLGSTVRVADTSFAAVDLQRYTPFGQKRNPPVEGAIILTDRKFTGQIEDASIGLQWLSSRAYDPALGRFLQPDTVVPGAGNPQALNRYSYVINNPLKLTDPSGHAESDEFGGGDGGEGLDSVDGARLANQETAAARQVAVEPESRGLLARRRAVPVETEVQAAICKAA